MSGGAARGLLRNPSAWAIAAGLVALVLVARALLAPRAQLPSYFTIPPFTLTSHEGEPFGSADLAGRTWVAGFFFTRCPSICPALLHRQSEVRARTDDLGDAVQLVTISIDPDHDTPEVLRRAAQERGLVLDRWTLLTGPTRQIQDLVRDGFKEYMSNGPDVPPAEVVHSVRFFLVDGAGAVRGLYDANDPAEIDRLVRDARALSR